MRHAQLSLAECRRMIRWLEYTLQGQVKGLPLLFNMWNYFSVTGSGDMEAYPDHVECQREETRNGDQQPEDEIVLLELWILLRDEHFLPSMDALKVEQSICSCHVR